MFYSCVRSQISKHKNGRKKIQKNGRRNGLATHTKWHKRRDQKQSCGCLNGCAQRTACITRQEHYAFNAYIFAHSLVWHLYDKIALRSILVAQLDTKTLLIENKRTHTHINSLAFYMCISSANTNTMATRNLFLLKIVFFLSYCAKIGIEITCKSQTHLVL